MKGQIMSQIHVEVSQVINARAEAVYGVISDYKVGHAAILPKPYFVSLDVEEGGQGAGTVVRAEMKVMGVEQQLHMMVSEPEPGRVMIETDSEAGIVTSFTVDPVGNGEQSRITIVTDSKASPGFKGFMEQLMNPPVTRYIYRKELRQLAEYLHSPKVVSVPAR